jgi:hypothetical protein
MKPTTPAPHRSTLPAPAAEPVVSLGLAAAVYFGLALLYFLPALLPGRHIFGTDYLQAGYFFYDFISQRTAEGTLPKWVPYVYGGLPLYSNPGSTYYPVRWVADLIFPTSKFFPFLFWIQFGMAGLGMYLLAVELGCRRWVAFVAGLAFQWTGITTSWVYAGHDGRIIVGTLMPLFFFFLRRGIRTGRPEAFAGVAATTGFFLLSFQIQNAYYLLLGGAIWAVYSLVELRATVAGARRVRTVGLGIAAVAFGFLMAAVNFLPFTDYVGESPRGQTGGRGYEFSTSYSMPPRAIVGIAVPEQVGATIQNESGQYVFPVYRGENAFRLHTEYVGALVVVLLALGVAYGRRVRAWWFFAGLALFALSLSLGGNTPLYRLYYEVLPGLKRFRAPDLAYFLMAFSLVAMAAITLERLAALRDEVRARRPSAAAADPLASVLWIAGGVAVAGLVGAVVFGGASAGMAEGTSGLTPTQGWLRFTVFAAAVAAVLWSWTAGQLQSRMALIALSLITVADLWVIGKKFLMTVDAPEVTYAQDDISTFLLSQPQRGRVWPVPGGSAWPRYIDQPMHYGLELAGGEHGNQLERYNQFAGPGQSTMVDFHNFNDPRFLAAGNVRWLVLSQQVQAPFLREAYRGAEAIVYENTLALPRAFLVPEVQRITEGSSAINAMKAESWDPRRTAVVEANADLGLPATPLQGTADLTSYAPDRVVVRTRASRPALLVLSDNAYKGWVAKVDGRESRIFRTNHTFRGVVVPAGEHQVEFTFHPRDLYTGLYIHLATLALLLAYGVTLLLRRRRREDAAPVAA